MALVVTLITGGLFAFMVAVADYFRYENDIAQYNAWALATNVNAQ